MGAKLRQVITHYNRLSITEPELGKSITAGCAQWMCRHESLTDDDRRGIQIVNVTRESDYAPDYVER